MMSGNRTANEIAARLGMLERTLHRRLREQGTSFQLELNAVSHETARQLLDARAMPGASVVETLTYSDVSAFNRAFKRWTAFTPARSRAKNLTPLKHICDDFRIDETA
jgi:AraC-like DNA-binding protein